MITNSKKHDLVANIFAKVGYKIGFSNKKGNKSLLNIDILKSSVKKELLNTTVFHLEKIYTELLNQPPSDAFNLLQRKGDTILLFLIKKTGEDFLANKYGYKVDINLLELKKSLYTENVLSDAEILFQIPFYALSNPRSSKFRLVYYPVYNSASPFFIEALVDNLILVISNCIVYFIILKFSSVYAFRQTLYRSQFLSLRNFERFKNNLSWQAQIHKYIHRPLNLYNNRYTIYVLRTQGIYSRNIYANLSKEINTLGKLPLLTILFVEIRDFTTSRFDETFYNIVKSVRFTLTSVIGQVIGLIWRGIIEGLKK